ncbi:[FeFe] hydrogenase H-cluster maturation GTPase HydF [Nitratidesulfovibrio liaohensis]|uniref:[FeFe] hydrogenase H-cluster maturation GTPase HydF n=1 Tax=Nitratidesulfovibrio liaohensis TaxID=2604158 RepID=UPI0014207E79|nr:[FeFe] hydrogenase H-cluster maturation GTPase HydF [Nitratidesulfovibrio liaohensis]NHZ46042.1 [FeFe] hydrogenase H-cluster maturation GTPase HydF [Nitratidesulfovibrio liaohensis]
MQDTPRGLRLHIGIYGRRNVGKSSLLNGLVGQGASIVSDTPGTTTDPVEKTLELDPVGPVVFIDTAGIDDEGALGALRRERSERALDRTDVALLVTDGAWGRDEEALAEAFAARKLPYFVVANKVDLAEVMPGSQLPATVLDALAGRGIAVVAASALLGRGLDAVRERIAMLAPEHAIAQPHMLSDLVPPGGLVVLVVPIDLGAPRGRLILPQVQAIRDLLDGDQMCLVVKERELRAALERLSAPPDLVVCDSQVVLKAAADTPPGVPLTTFSILMARLKGDLVELARGAAAIERLGPGDRVLIAEACTHHPLADDIGRVKIPRWLRQYAGGDIEIDVAAGKELSDDMAAYALVVHCGGCVINRGNMLARLRAARRAGVPMTNYGLAISLTQGVLPRALGPFPAALDAFRAAAKGA